MFPERDPDPHGPSPDDWFVVGAVLFVAALFIAYLGIGGGSWGM